MAVRTIDYVVPMVFPDDPSWRDEYRSTGHRYDERDLCEFVRYRSWGTEELLVRCVRRFMPFVRTIFIVLSGEGQRKAWMDGDGITVVYHRDFIPHKYLPLFNSCSFEMFIYRIPGLSERFLYGNDDMFPVSPLTEEDFFHGSVPCLHHDMRPFPQAPNTFHNICRNAQDFVGREFGRRFDGVLIRGGHSITPMLIGTWRHLWRIGAKDIEASITPFRENRNMIQWICPWWHYLSGNYVDRVPGRAYVSTKDSVDDVRKALMGADGIVCVNDNECEGDYLKYGAAVRECLETILDRQ